MSAITPSILSESERDRIRLDQWLWFARFCKSRSLAARLCLAGAVTVNGAAAKKPNRAVRVGDLVVVPQGAWVHAVRVSALGVRRGPAAEARRLYQEEGLTVRREPASDWVPLLDPDAAADFPAPSPSLT